MRTMCLVGLNRGARAVRRRCLYVAAIFLAVCAFSDVSGSHAGRPRQHTCDAAPREWLRHVPRLRSRRPGPGEAWRAGTAKVNQMTLVTWRMWCVGANP